MVNARSRCIWWRTVLHWNTVSTTIPFKEGISPNVSGEMTQRVRGAHTRFARHGAHSQMTGAVRFPEQLCLMTDGGRWSGHSKAMTVTFNLLKQHANKHRNTPTTTAHYNIFSPSTPCMSDCYPVCWGYGLPQGEPEQSQWLSRSASP